MAASTNGRSIMEAQDCVPNCGNDRLKSLYPMVNEEETPLPRSWSPKDKFNYIGLSQNNLRVHYKGEQRQQPLSKALCGQKTLSSAFWLPGPSIMPRSFQAHSPPSFGKALSKLCLCNISGRCLQWRDFYL